ncbi:MAG: hypothetical protein BAJATHORv1_50170 [Candidatus Thorarchaeota archaeon]|nr:MAG: hypothetical protein BAJATHORv1_50170 [Candidatus Thorarchaeota archaeon]
MTFHNTMPAQSSYRKVLVEGIWKRNQVEVKVIQSSWAPTQKQLDFVENEWKQRPGGVYNGPLWRFERVVKQDERVSIEVSKCSYKWHFILRQQHYQAANMYPNPTSVTSLIVTTDQKIVLGVRKGSDQGGMLHTVGGGFVDPKLVAVENQHNQWKAVPECLFETSAREIAEETSLTEGEDYSKEDFRMLGIVWGGNHDTSCVMYAPVNVSSTEVAIRGKEHSYLFFPSIDDDTLSSIVENNGLPIAEDIDATDHMVLAISLLRKYLNSI